VKLDKNRAILLLLSVFPLLVGSGIAISILGGSLIGQLVSHTYVFTASELAVQAIVSTVFGLVVVMALFWVIERGGRGTKRLAVAFVISPILGFVSLFLGEAFLLILFKGSIDVLRGVILLLSLGVSMVSIAFVILDAIPSALRSMFVAFYGSVFGTFLGVTMVTTSMVVIVISIVFEDYFLTRFSPAAQAEQVIDRIGSDPFDYARIQSSQVAVGAGDYITYSLIAAHSILFFPLHVWAMTLILMIVGVIINVTVLAREGAILPAIPLPALLALFPWSVHAAALALLAG